MSWLLRRLLALWVRYKILPEHAAAQLRDWPRPLCYVLEQRSATDLAVLEEACARLGIPKPGRLLLGGTPPLRSYLWLTQRRGLLVQRLDRRPPRQLARMIAALRSDPQLDFDLVPAAVYWGRAPHKEASWLGLFLSEDFGFASRARKLVQVLFNGRDTLLELDEPLSLRTLLGAELAGAQRGFRVARTLRALYARQRAARIGPDLSHRRTIVTRVLRTRAVRAAVAQEMRERRVTRYKALQQARGYAWEIAANYSHAFVRFMEHALGWLWNRLYDGVVFGHAATLGAVAEGNELIYVPCHRSHMDYLLLGYAIYVHGYAVPHTAAGVNLNLPLVGRFLRKGGAFFIRRSFGGNRLYTVVFMKYLAAIMSRGHPIEYFIEGGRSRTGRLLQPKTGMLLMTVRSFLADPSRPVVFVPVYFGYERLVEGATYVGELSGRPKEKESIRGLLGSWRVLRQRFGKVHVNLGEPIALAEILERHERDWRAQRWEEEARTPWLAAAVDELAERIMRNINAAAAVTPVSLLALALLATPRQALPEADLTRQLELYKSLLISFPYSNRVTVTVLTGAEIVAYGQSLRLIEREPHSLGDIVRMSAENAVLATYFRNNVLHLFALPSLIACVFASNARVSTADIQRLAWRVYPYIGAELFLHWSEAELPAVVEATLAALAAQGLIEPEPDGGAWRRPSPASAQAMQLSLLAQTTLQIIERYYMVVAQLVLAGSGTLTQPALEERCQQTAQRMTLLSGLDSPEFSDRSMFANFIALLRARGVIRAAGGGVLEYDEVLVRVAQDAQFVLSEQLRHSILQIMHS
ncbi:MAG: glycerol-3-phosphate 1-O-acyltransferase PlsB [Gammaproteobacteria bacterium]|nr:glycerol-3-phosphate 1-O-acyltransferase PlsB [Gammaproteobacteria bacterium]